MAGSNSINSPELQQYIERIEKLNDEIGDIQDDRKDVFAEAKAQGYDPKIMRKVIAYRKMQKEARDEERALVDTYLNALGLL